MTQSALFAPPRRPVMRYHGGKFRIRNWIIAEFPPHSVYVEPFGGGASVLLGKERSHAEVYNDLDGEIVNVFRVLRDPDDAGRLDLLLRLTPFSRDELAASYEPTDDHIEAARRTIVRSFMGFSSASATKAHRTGFRGNATKSRVTSAVDWANYVDHLPSFVTRLRGVEIENRRADQIIRKYDSADTLFYVDPPYPLDTRYDAARRGDCYRFDMSCPEHRLLAELLLAVRGMVVLSSYPSADYARLYAGWRQVTRRSFASGQRSSSPRTEVLWISPRADARRATA